MGNFISAIGDPYYDKVLVHVPFIGNHGSSSFVDRKGNAITLNGSPIISTEQFRNPGSSGYFNGSAGNQWLSLPNAIHNLGNIFTIEGWFYPNSVPGPYPSSAPAANRRWDMFGRGGGSSLTGQIPCYYNNQTFVFVRESNAGGGTISLYDSIVSPIKKWYHYALVADGTKWYLFINGRLAASVASTTGWWNPGGTFDIGRQFVINDTQWGSMWDGYIQDFRITKGVARYTQAFGIPASAFPTSPNKGSTDIWSNQNVGTGDPYYDKVVLLLPMNGANNSTVFTDNKNRVWTTNGNAKIVTTQSKFNGSSGFFDGTSGAYLSAANSSDFDFSASDATIECWIYPTAYHSICSMPFSQRGVNNGGGGWDLGYGSSGSLFLQSSSSDLSAPNGSIKLNEWQHVAFVKGSSNSAKLFVNGIIVASGTLAFNASAITPRIGRCYDNNGGPLPVIGYMQDMRITKGVARYSANFSIPTSAFPSTLEISNTKFLARMEGANDGVLFPDDYGHAISGVNGDVKTVSSHLQYRPNYAVFNGSSDYWSTPDAVDLRLGGVDWTIEAFVCPKTSSGYRNTIQKRGASTEWQMSWNSGNNRFEFYTGSNSYFSTTALPINVWAHIALSYTVGNSTLKMYLNGILDAVHTSVTLPAGSTNPVQIGATSGGTEFFNGNMGEIRITKGTARYASVSFTPPTFLPELDNNSDIYYDSTSLILRCEGPNASTSFFDLSKIPKTITPTGNAQISTSVVKYGTGSLVLDTSGDYLTIPSHADFIFGTGDFSIEFWINSNTNASGNAGILSHRDTFPGIGGWIVEIYGAIVAGPGNIFIRLNLTNPDTVLDITMTASVWHHVAFCRKGSNLYAFLDGALYATGTTSSNLNTSNSLIIGKLGWRTESWAGNLDDIRITKGIARYTANFTPQEILPITTFLITGKNGMVDEKGHVLTKTGTSAYVANTYLPNEFAYFDGTGDYLTYSNHPDFDFGSSDFTVECWFYPNRIGPDIQELVGCANGWQTNNNHSFAILILASGVVRGTFCQGISQFDAPAGTIILNTWNHVVFTRSGNTIKTYLNGVGGSGVSVTGTINNPANSLLFIGASHSNYYFYNGFIRDVRITKGLARYISVPVYPTVLLLHMDGTNASTTFTDSSPSAKAISVFNNAQISTSQSKFGGSSAFFDGSGDYLRLNGSTDWQFGSGDFTVELWYYKTSHATIGSYKRLIQFRDGDVACSISIVDARTSNGNLSLSMSSNGTSWDIINDADVGAIALNMWTHIAVVRFGTSIKLYINGVSTYSISSSTPLVWDASWQPVIGGQSGTDRTLNGWIDELRILKGVAAHKANFTPPTVPYANETFFSPFSSPISRLPEENDPYKANVVFLNHFNGSNNGTYFTDETGKVPAVGGSPKTVTSDFKFGGSSLYFPSGTTYLDYPAHADFGFGTGDFTIEFWAKPITSSGIRTILDSRPGNNAEPWGLGISDDNKVRSYDGGSIRVLGDVSINLWHHFAWSRNSDVNRIYLDGIQVQTWIEAKDFLASRRLVIGVSTIATEQFVGYLNDLRLTKGVGRYTVNFIPPLCSFANR